MYAYDLEGYNVFVLSLYVEDIGPIIWGVYSNSAAAHEVGKKAERIWAQRNKVLTYTVRDFTVEG